jgi:hypothetical protein
MSPEDLDRLLEKAAERGADCALRKVGLHDEDAGRDMAEVRDLLENWRETKKTISQTIARIITTAILAIMAMGTWHYWGSPK